MMAAKEINLAVVVTLSLLSAVLVVSLPSASGQSVVNPCKQWEKVIREAKKQGKVVVFGPVGTKIRETVVGEFTKPFPGIRIEYSGGRGTETAAKIRSERDAGMYSVGVVSKGLRWHYFFVDLVAP